MSNIWVYVFSWNYGLVLDRMGEIYGFVVNYGKHGPWDLSPYHRCRCTDLCRHYLFLDDYYVILYIS